MFESTVGSVPCTIYAYSHNAENFSVFFGFKLLTRSKIAVTIEPSEDPPDIFRLLTFSRVMKAFPPVLQFACARNRTCAY
jgi:hypothetical protein